MKFVGKRDAQSASAGGARAKDPSIAGVRIFELGNVLTRSGFMTEIFRSDWPVTDITVRQVNWVELNPAAVTDWHAHAGQTDHLIGVGGVIKLALWDGRDGSQTYGATDVIRIGAMRPVMVIVPPVSSSLVWNAARSASSAKMAGVTPKNSAAKPVACSLV